jgi:hypothetical protein
MARGNEMYGVLSKNVTYTDTTAVTVGYLPPNSHIIDIICTVGTAFNAGGNDYIDVGDSSTANKYANDINVASTGKASVTVANVGAVQSSTGSTEIKAVYVPSGTSPTAGSGYVNVLYVQL